MIRDHFAEYVAIALWAAFALCVTVFRHHVPQQQVSFVGAVTLTVSGIAIARRYRGPRLKPGQIVVGIEDHKRAERLAVETIAALHADDPADKTAERALRSV